MGLLMGGIDSHPSSVAYGCGWGVAGVVGVVVDPPPELFERLPELPPLERPLLLPAPVLLPVSDEPVVPVVPPVVDRVVDPVSVDDVLPVSLARPRPPLPLALPA